MWNSRRDTRTTDADTEKIPSFMSEGMISLIWKKSDLKDFVKKTGLPKDLVESAFFERNKRQEWRDLQRIPQQDYKPNTRMMEKLFLNHKLLDGDGRSNLKDLAKHLKVSNQNFPGAKINHFFVRYLCLKVS